LAARVLIIDDDNDFIELIKNLLSLENFDIFSTSNSIEGANKVLEIRPDIVLLDLMMPGKDGIEVCQEIRKTNNVPILIVSAVSTRGILSKVLNEGADDFLEKPVHPQILLANIHKLLRSSVKRA
jgi:DNA-binding response OmpR family regulator